MLPDSNIQILNIISEYVTGTTLLPFHNSYFFKKWANNTHAQFHKSNEIMTGL